MKYRKLKGYKYELMEYVRQPVDVPDTPKAMSIGFQYYLYISNGILVIKKHYAWDGPSGPTIDTKSFMLGSLVHDALYQLMREGFLDRKYRNYADKLLRQICLVNGMSKLRAWYVYQAVKLFGKRTSLPRKNPRGQILEA